MPGICLLLLSTLAQADAEGDEFDVPVAAETSASYQFQIQSDSGYTDERGRSIIDVIEGYKVNLALTVGTETGNPVIGLKPQFKINGSSTLIPPGERTPLESTDESGILEFGITAGRKGMDKLTVSYGKNEATVYFNVISLAINTAPKARILDDGLNWWELMKADIEFVEGELKVNYPESILSQAGETVQVSGFIMPLEAGIKQRRFLLTSSPPHCFFHIPGGPAGVIEVFSEEGIETSFEAVQIEGRLELVGGFAQGIIYQIRDAEVVET